MISKVGIIGSGAVGRTLANGFVTHGYEVMIGTENANKRSELSEATSGKAKESVITILSEFDWEHEDMGAAEAARAIEPLAMLWCIPGFRENR